MNNQKRYILIISWMLGLSFILRLALLPGAAPDDAEQLVYAQSLQAGYAYKNPPLFTWLVFFGQQIFGPSLWVIVALRYIVLGGIYALFWRIAQRCLPQPVVLAAALSPLALWFLGWDALFNYTHSLLLVLACLVLLDWLTQPRERFSLRDYGTLGIILAFGLLAKYNFIFFAAASFAVAAFRPVLRQKLFRWCLFFSFALTALTISPHLIWIMQHREEVKTAITSVLQIHKSPFYGLLRLGTAIIGFCLPFLALFIGFFAKNLSLQNLDEEQKFLLLVPCTLLVITLGALIGTHAGHIRNHHLFMLAVLPLCLFSMVDTKTKFIDVYTNLLILIALLIPMSVIVVSYMQPRHCHKCFTAIDYRPYVTQLQKVGFQTGTILSYSSDFAEPGENLRRYFPDNQLVVTNLPWYQPPAREQRGDCLIVWDETRNPELSAVAAQKAGTETIKGLLLPSPSQSPRTADTLGYYLIKDGNAACTAGPANTVH